MCDRTEHVLLTCAKCRKHSWAENRDLPFPGTKGTWLRCPHCDAPLTAAPEALSAASFQAGAEEQERSAYWKGAYDRMAERNKEMGEEMDAISKEVGCVVSPGIALRFVKQLRADLGKAHTRNEELIRSWDKATPTERKELDRLRRGWGPSTPTERQARQADLLEAKTIISIAMEELVTSEGDISDAADFDERLNEAYAKLSKGYGAICEKLQNLAGLERYGDDFQAGAEAMREEAAKVAEEAHPSWDASEQELTDYGKTVRRICQGTAKAIRSLPIPASSEAMPDFLRHLQDFADLNGGNHSSEWRKGICDAVKHFRDTIPASSEGR